MTTTVTMLAMRGTLSANGWRRAACVLHEVAGEVDETLAEAGARPAPLCVHVNDGEAGRLGIQHLGLPIDIADERGYEFLRHFGPVPSATPSRRKALRTTTGVPTARRDERFSAEG